MLRLGLALAVLVYTLSPALANRAGRQSSLHAERPLPRALVRARASQRAPAEGKAESNRPYAVNEQSEVQLNGRPCKYEQIPADAEITLLEVTPDRTILRIHFQSKKR